MAKPAIVFHVDNGMVISVISDCEVDVYIVDHDGEDEDHPHYVAELEATLWKEDVHIAPHEVSDVQKKWVVC
jgi:hypothetical protein